MGLIVDSGILILAERQGRTAKQALSALDEALAEERFAISAITITELAHGIARAASQSRARTRTVFLDDLLAVMTVLEITGSIARSAGILDGELRNRGLDIGLADLLIACTALQLDYGVVTANVRHFSAVPGLRVVTMP